MDALRQLLGDNFIELPQDEVVKALSLRREDVLKNARSQLFDQAVATALVHQKDVLVRRLKRACGPSISTKYAQDIATLLYHLKNRTRVTRTLLRNGKRSAADFSESRERRPSVELSIQDQTDVVLPHNQVEEAGESGNESDSGTLTG